MRSARVSRFFVVVYAIVFVAGLVAVPLWAEKASTETLGGADRYLTHLSTDKPIYRAGEKVHVRGVLLRAKDHVPLETDEQVRAMIEIRGPKGDVVASGWSRSEDSVLAFSWEVPDGQAGGEYKIKATYPIDGHPPAERKFDIRAFRAPRLKTQIVFLRDGYGPGDEVSATVHVERAEGGIPAGADVTVIGRVDGEEVYTGPAKVDAEGNCTGRFKLPDEIARGEGTIAFVIEDGGVVETATKTIPILLQTVDLQMFPEGGDLVAGLPNRVYLEAKTPAKKPADIAGVVVDAKGNTVAEFRTEHEGRGRFTFTPQALVTYKLKINEPAGITTTYDLPMVKHTGAVIQASEERTAKRQPVRLAVGATKARGLTVTLSQREVEVASTKIVTKPGEMQDVSLDVPPEIDGVLIATVWTLKGKPLAERLVYREPAESVRIKITPDQDTYVPGDEVELTVETTDYEGKPVEAVVGLTVTDDSVLEMIEKREQAPRLPVMVLIEDDVRELADAHVYLDDENPEAPLALDLLLGTQGWRRFAFVETTEFVAAHGDAARRVLALKMPSERERRLAFGGGPGGFGGGVQEGALVMRGAAAEPPPVAAPAARFAVDADADGAEPVVADEIAVAANDEAAPAAQRRPADLVEARLDAPAEPEDRKRLREAMAKAKEEAGVPMIAALAAEDDFERRQNSFVAVRVYAHAVRPDRKPGDRVDFTETVFWNAGVKTNKDTGKATVAFALSDAVTAFRVFADAFTDQGALGQATTTLESVEPFYIEPKMPLEVTGGDVVRLPVALVNGVSRDLSDVSLLTTTDPGLKVGPIDPLTLSPRERGRRIVEITVGNLNGASDFVLSATAGSYSDRVTRKLRVKPLGFPLEIANGGMLGPDNVISHAVTIPANVVPGSVTTSAAVYPTPLANMTQALERLIREPYGCFEQTSSTTYPLVMAQQYFQSHTGVDPALIERSREMLDKGYARLVSFECDKKGYEWFGADPGHEALTAYGLLEFTDMARVRDMDSAMVERTRKWLLDRRDGQGGFELDEKALDSFGRAPQATTNAYITWALLEAGEKGLDTEVNALRKVALATDDSYIKALAANVLSAENDRAAARKLMEQLVTKQNDEGCVEGATTSITRSGGQALNIETTALAVLAWLEEPAFTPAVQKGMKYISESCESGRYGSTQSTVLALRAIVEYDKSRARPKAPGSVELVVDGKPIDTSFTFTKDRQGAIELPDFSEMMSPGEHTIELRMTDGSSMPYALTVNCNVLQPPSSEESSLDLGVSLSEDQIEEGAVTEANVVVANRTEEGLPTPVAIIGLPGGLEPRHDQLKELVKSGKIDAYEVIGREVVLYWREMKPQQKIELPLSLVAAVPGTYTGPASRTYLYYTDEFKTWVEGVKVDIVPREGA